MHKPGKTCCRTTSHILKLTRLIDTASKREDIMYKHDKTCCRTTSHILKLTRLIDTARQTWRYHTQTRQNMLPNNISYTQTNSTYWHCEANVKISCTNTAKHAAGQHFIYSNNSTYWHCEANVKISYTNTAKHAAEQHLIYSNNSTYWHCEAKREDIIHKHGKTCCRTTFHILKLTRLIDTARQT
jgi:hypothetical protein